MSISSIRTYLIISVFLCFCCSIAVFSAGSQVSTEDIIQKIDACLKTSTPNTITEYACPKRGSFFVDTKLPISDERIAYIVIASIQISEIDKEVEKVFRELQEKRLASPTIWAETISEQVDAIKQRYSKVCGALGGDVSIAAEWAKKNKISLTTDGFPLTYCNNLVEKRLDAWEKLGYMIASTSIPKVYQNSKDLYMQKLKSRYNKLFEIWGAYQVVVGNAVQKFTAYIKDPIQR